ncbi:MAG TPA: transketolase family protein [Thermodesulfobacteriota bacterium]|nr:transketolase family protein [Thermodesulfobacteriota bacterium]
MKLTGIREAYGETLAALGEIYPEIVVLDADLSGSTKTSLFAKKFPDRFFNLGVAEQNLMGTAAGLATSGKTVFASTFAIFASGRAWEQVRYNIAYNQLNVKIVASHGGVTVGEDGGSHQSAEDIAIMRVLPGMRVIVPMDGKEMQEVIKTVVKIPGPFYIRSSRVKFPLILGDDYTFELGKGKILRQGKDISLIGCGLMVSQCLEAAEILAKEGIAARVVSISTIKPIDEELLIDCSLHTGGIVTAEEHSVIGGLGSAVAEVVSEKKPTRIVRIGVRDQFGVSGSAPELLEYLGLTTGNIFKAAQQIMGHKSQKAAPLV